MEKTPTEDRQGYQVLIPEDADVSSWRPGKVWWCIPKSAHRARAQALLEMQCPTDMSTSRNSLWDYRNTVTGAFLDVESTATAPLADLLKEREREEKKKKRRRTCE